MALVGSIHVELKSTLPIFTLSDTSGITYDSKDLSGDKGLLVIVTCNHCPYAIAVWPRLVRLAKAFRAKGINSIAINPNIHPDFPQDSPSAMLEKIEEWGIDFPYLVDDTQEVAQALDAQCTPDIYLYDAEGQLYYHGRIDDYWKDESKVTQKELEPAMDALIAAQPAPKKQYPTVGCSIKWNDA
ncbi:MAG: thioredoxin family protein [Mariprofundaceae bacterium]|nr:thioredoxin family protein [Mariprofundaceae bacterium]